MIPAPSIMSKDQICRLLNCSLVQLNEQYKANAKALRGMHQIAVKTGKKVNGYTADELKGLAAKYEFLYKQ